MTCHCEDKKQYRTNMKSRNMRRRSRPSYFVIGGLTAAALVSLSASPNDDAATLLLPAVGAMVVKPTITTTNNAQTLLAQARNIRLQRNTKNIKKKKNIADESNHYDDNYWTDTLFNDDNGMVMDDVVKDVQRLQKSTGSEVLDSKLQDQIDASLLSPNEFLNVVDKDATPIEKVAMATITEQLPKPALKALQQQSASTKKMGTKTSNPKKKLVKIKNTKTITKKSSPAVAVAGSSVVKSRSKASVNVKKQKQQQSLTHEETLELAHQIQKGVKLHKIKSDFESKYGKEITKKEWTKLAKLDSQRTLRRQVVEYRKAKQLLVESNMGLVRTVVMNQYSSVVKATGITIEELIQEGSLGLLRAAELFDPNRGIRFSTYATIWIKGVLSDTHLLDGTIRLPTRERTKWNKIKRATEDLESASEKITHEAIAKMIGLSVEDVISTKTKMTNARGILSLDYEYDTYTRSGVRSEGSGTRSILQSKDKALMSDVDMVEQIQLRADIISSLKNNLKPKEERFIRLRYGLNGDNGSKPLKLSECADAMGVSESTVRGLYERSMKKLRQANDISVLQEYLLSIS